MPNDSPSLYDRITGKRHSDINLPNESNRVDPRLSDPAELIKALSNNSALQALKAYGQASAENQKKK